MLRVAAVTFGLLLVACSAAPAAPSASHTSSSTVAGASPPPANAPTATPAPTVARTPITLPSAAQIDAPSGTVVWVLVGDQNGRIFRSTDRGDTWRESSLPSIVPIVFSFTDDREGWAMVPRTGGVPPPPNGQCGSALSLVHTADGATTWQPVTATGIPVPGPCPSTIRFADAQRGYIAAFDPAGSPIVYRTGDGGRNWTASARFPDPPGFATRSDQGQVLSVGRVSAFGSALVVTAFPTNPSTGISYVYRSADGGATWTYASTASNRSQDVALVTATRWLQISSPGDSKETTDGGATWHAYTTDYRQAAPIGPALIFGDAQIGYATVRGGIQRTLDGGATWTAIRTPGTF